MTDRQMKDPEHKQLWKSSFAISAQVRQNKFIIFSCLNLSVVRRHCRCYFEVVMIHC